MTDLQILVRQTSNPSILKMQQRLHDEVVSLGKQALEWKANCEALQLALEVERDAANLYAKQVAHWIEKHDALLDQQLAAEDRAQRDADPLAELRAYALTVANLREQLAQQAPQVPMTDDEIIEYFDEVSPKLGFGLDDLRAFTSGAVCAQSHHGIKEKP